MKYYCFAVALDRIRTGSYLGLFSPCLHLFPKPFLVTPRRYQVISMGQVRGEDGLFLLEHKKRCVRYPAL